MNRETALEKCRGYVSEQIQAQKKSLAVQHPRPSGPAVTISHQTGSGAHEIAERLAEALQKSEPARECAWTVFDRQLVEKVLEEHHLPKALAKHMPEDRRSYIEDVMEELVGLRPPSWVLVPQVVETILHLAEAGHVVLVGRGANVVTERMPNVFHVRLIASLPRRIERVQKLHHLPPGEAAKFIEKEDRGRGRYVRAYFHTRLDDESLYHLVLNTDRVPYGDAVDLIAEGARRCFRRYAGNKK